MDLGGYDPDPSSAWPRGDADGLKSFRCGDVVPGCGRAFSGTTTEVLAQVAVHAARDHGLEPLGPDVVTAVRRAMTDA